MHLSRRHAVLGAAALPLLTKASGALAQGQPAWGPIPPLPPGMLPVTGQETFGPYYPVTGPRGHDLDLTRRIDVIKVDIRGFNREFAAFGHRIACVDRQIDDSDLKLVGVDIGAPQATAKDRLDRHLFAQGAPEQIGEAANKVADIDRLGFEWRLARKCEKSLRQRFSAA